LEISNNCDIQQIKMSTSINTPQKKMVKKNRKQHRNEKEVKLLQKKTTPMFPKITFKRIVKQEAKKHSVGSLRFNADAVEALQEATEQEMTTIFSGAA
jgi:histone H3/H4